MAKEKKRNAVLKETEWTILEALWEGRRTAAALAGVMTKKYGWVKNATYTLLSRMEEKGLIEPAQTGEGKAYVALVEESSMRAQETRSFIDKVFSGSARNFLVSFLGREDFGGELSDEDIEELREILERRGKGR